MITARQRLLIEAGRADRATAYVPVPRGGDGASAGTAARRVDILAGLDLGEQRAAHRELLASNPQVTAFSQVSSNTSREDLRKLSDLGRWAGRTAHIHERGILADPAKRRKKLAVETGWDDRYGEAMRPPLEAWTCPGPNQAMALYGEIMRAPDGTLTIGDFRGPQLGHVEYMRREELVSVGDDGRLHALSDMIRDEGSRAYPGAPVTDSRAKIGRQLRHHATGLVLAALFNISRGGVVHWSRKREQKVMEALGGLRLSAAQVCAEANQVKASRPDLEECRYLSVSTCREVIKALIDLGYIAELAGAKAIRRMRSWLTLPRVIGRLAEDLAGRAEDIAKAITRWRKQEAS